MDQALDDIEKGFAKTSSQEAKDFGGVAFLKQNSKSQVTFGRSGNLLAKANSQHEESKDDYFLNQTRMKRKSTLTGGNLTKEQQWAQNVISGRDRLSSYVASEARAQPSVAAHAVKMMQIQRQVMLADIERQELGESS